MSKHTKTQVLISGAGPAGCSTALFLAKAGIECVLIDKEYFPRDKICGDALSGKVVEVINKLNPDIIKEIAAHEKNFLGSWGVTFVAPSGEALRVPFRTSKSSNTQAPGFISKRLDFDNFLVEKVKQQSTVTLREGVELREFKKTQTGILARSKDGETYETQLFIACDGAYSSFSKDVAQLVTEPAHNCFGLRAYYKNVSGTDAENFIELHFIKEALPGYFWIFPLPGGYVNVGVGMRADKLHQKKVNLPKLFDAVIQNNPAIAQRFSNANKQSGVKLFGLPLGSKKRPISGNHYMLCGDAAQLIDPFTGEGIGNAMMSGMFAAEQVQRSLKEQNFSAEFMRQYDETVYNRLWDELLLSYRLQQLVNYPSLFNLVVKKANNNPLLSETISCMFEDLDMRSRLKNPLFYLRLLFS